MRQTFARTWGSATEMCCCGRNYKCSNAANSGRTIGQKLFVCQRFIPTNVLPSQRGCSQSRRKTPCVDVCPASANEPDALYWRLQRHQSIDWWPVVTRGAGSRGKQGRAMCVLRRNATREVMHVAIARRLSPLLAARRWTQQEARGELRSLAVVGWRVRANHSLQESQ